MLIAIIVFGIIIFIIITAALAGGALWLTSRARRLTQGQKPARDTVENAPSFHWRYIILPLVILLVSIFLAAYFYHLLPAEVAYHFQLDGTADRWLGREMIVSLGLIPQILLTLLAFAITLGIVKLGILSRSAESAWVKPETMLMLMGNIIGLPQLIIGFAMLDIFSYNSYQLHIMPMWIFLIIILGLATIALGLFFFIFISKVKRAQVSQRRSIVE